MDYTEALNIGRMAAQAGAAVVREQFGLSQNSRIKASSHTLVTDTDIAAETAILKILSSHSEYGILSEESGLSGESKGRSG
jgi:fructose-1,6-bisphosphatase/inositol monophosphatase family enzyme